MLKAMIFDVDGTLLDSNDYHAESWREAFANFGKTIPVETIRKQIGKGGDQLMPVFLTEEEMARNGDRLKADRDRIFKERYLPLVRPFPKVRELFIRIKQSGVRIALASSGSAKEVAEYKRIAHVGDLLETETSSDDAEHSKPHPDIFLAALERLSNITPKQALVVGDTPYDAQAAQEAGLRAVGVLCGGFPEAELREAGCSAIYRDPAHLLAEYEFLPR
jgi:phosphoglycolate phosphatase-like HAD superfamily hydrolase